jgi:hypothetical protein
MGTKAAPRPSMASSHVARRIKTGGTKHCKTTSARPGRFAKTNRIMDFFGSLPQMRYAQRQLWLAGQAPSSCLAAIGGACALAIPARVTSARIKPRLRHGRGRCLFAKWPISSLRTSTATQIQCRTRRDMLSKDGLCGFEGSIPGSYVAGHLPHFGRGAAVGGNAGGKRKNARAKKKTLLHTSLKCHIHN